MLELRDLASGYAGTKGVVVDPVSLTLEAGDFICVIGRNGAGKSTLMRTISGLQPALSGDALLAGQSIPTMSSQERAQSISVVTTDRVSSPGLLARDVIELGRQPYTNWRGQLTNEDISIVEEATYQAGAVTLAPKPFDSLSDGERQRVMIARALAQTSKVLVLDEITAFLDLPGRVEIMALLRRHARETGKIVLLSSHDLELSLELVGQLWIVHDGELSFGSPNTLITNGVIEQAFDNSDVSFDPSQKRFTMNSN
ncbi:MAG: ABC transporter ATP-binding protein [Pseudomonadales bacterium]|nr:ABC transporter ATP-binding protein [Pseudomonadales bacterium]